jgi:regulator of protease activity HflC (stomatin/prohibitin superfamily)
VSVSIPLQLAPEDKLDVLRCLDEFHYWNSLDDRRSCKRCGRIITGRQIVILEAQGTRRKLRLQCPTAGCVSTPGEWAYANPLQAAKVGAVPRAPADKSAEHNIQDDRRDRAKRAGKAKAPAAKRASNFFSSHSFRAALARQRLLRPLATALHAFRPVA